VRIVQISDTHFCEAGGVMRPNFERVAEYVNETLRPDLIVHTGDAVILFPDEEADRSAAWDALRTLDAPLLVLPGNHDVGEPGPEPWAGIGVTSERVDAHRRTFGPDRFAETFGNWAVVGLNSEILGSGLPEEDDQWEWLEGMVAGDLPADVVLFLHKPVWTPDGWSAAGHSVTIPDDTRTRLLDAFRGRTLHAVGSGHLHCHREYSGNGPLELWAPSTAFMVDLPGLPPGRLGLIEWQLDDDGVRTTLHMPPGLDEREPRDVPELIAGITAVAPEALAALPGKS
jgi:3',5'-cyclic AMP phosphodiesterase CpdA